MTAGFWLIAISVAIILAAIIVRNGIQPIIENWKWVVGAMGVTLLAGGIWWAVGNLPHDWFAQVRNWPYWPQALGLVVGILLIWFLQSKKLWKPVILVSGLASLIWLGWMWHNMPSKPKPVVEFPGEVPGEVPMSFDGKKFMVVYPNQVVIVNTEGRIRVRQEGFDILDDLPQHRIEFPQGRIWCKVTSEEADSISKGSKYLDAWNSKEKAEVFRPKSGNAIVGYRVRGSEPKKLAIFVPLNKD